MRQIDIDAAAAFWAREKFKSGATQVTTNLSPRVVKLLLHDNTIAIYYPGREILVIDLCRWNTPTTRARLNAVLNKLSPVQLYSEHYQLPLRMVKGTLYLFNAEWTGKATRIPVNTPRSWEYVL